MVGALRGRNSPPVKDGRVKAQVSVGLPLFLFLPAKAALAGSGANLRFPLSLVRKTHHPLSLPLTTFCRHNTTTVWARFGRFVLYTTSSKLPAIQARIPGLISLLDSMGPGLAAQLKL